MGSISLSTMKDMISSSLGLDSSLGAKAIIDKSFIEVGLTSDIKGLPKKGLAVKQEMDFLNSIKETLCVSIGSEAGRMSINADHISSRHLSIALPRFAPSCKRVQCNLG